MLAPDALGPTVCLGEILVEIMATTLGEGFLAPQPLTGPYPSGAPAIFASQCGRLGGQVAMVGAVGDDDFGRLNLARLAVDGVDVSAVAIDRDWPTGSAFVRYRADGNRDFVFNIARSAAARLEWTNEVAALIARAGHLHVMGSALTMEPARAMILRAAAAIKARGGSLSLDPNLRKELDGGAAIAAAFDRVAGMADLILPSGEELFHAAGVASGSEQEAISALFTRGAAEVVVKRGRSGATAFLPDGVHHAAAFDVAEVDATGAGDCFGAAYVTCRRLGMPVTRALDYACAAGARNVTVQGPMEGAGGFADLDRFIASTERHP
ncbi:MAG: sugar kinase [Paracoccaceae bacterium]